MKTIISCLLSVLSLLWIQKVHAQGFIPPAPGKAVVYFVRTKPYYNVDIRYFHNDRYIGELIDKGYFRYECDTGLQLFWTYTEHKQCFVEACLKDSDIYIINYLVTGRGYAIISPLAGTIIGSSQNNLVPLVPGDKDLLKDSKKLINRDPPVYITELTYTERNEAMKKTVKEILEKYKSQWKPREKYLRLLPSMALPPEAIK